MGPVTLGEHEIVALALARGMSAHAVEWLAGRAWTAQHCEHFAQAVEFVGNRHAGTALAQWVERIAEALRIAEPGFTWWQWLNRMCDIRDDAMARMAAANGDCRIEGDDATEAEQRRIWASWLAKKNT